MSSASTIVSFVYLSDYPDTFLRVVYSSYSAIDRDYRKCDVEFLAEILFDIERTSAEILDQVESIQIDYNYFYSLGWTGDVEYVLDVDPALIKKYHHLMKGE